VVTDKKIYIFQHVAHESAGLILNYLDKTGRPYETVRLYEQNLPRPERVGGLIVMGGPMNVYEEDRYPFLAAETQFIRGVVDRGLPCLGICLGAQLIAKALGARVYKARKPEMGWGDVQLTDLGRKDPLFKGLEPVQRVLQWHEDTFDVPSGGVLMAQNEIAHQAYKVGARVYGFQYHFELTESMADEWFAKRPEWDAVRSEYQARKGRFHAVCTQILGNYFQIEGD